MAVYEDVQHAEVMTSVETRVGVTHPHSPPLGAGRRTGPVRSWLQSPG